VGSYLLGHTACLGAIVENLWIIITSRAASGARSVVMSLNTPAC